MSNPEVAAEQLALAILEPHRRPLDADNYDPITMDTEQYLRDNPEVAAQIVQHGFLQ